MVGKRQRWWGRKVPYEHAPRGREGETLPSQAVACGEGTQWASHAKPDSPIATKAVGCYNAKRVRFEGWNMPA